ncbi:adenylate cyclase type 10-like [Chelonoidis abingdonii]|uniref:adenylate cyclase type 10-like n=1 Tax=Chelonoidis abingdonii TaxID=106734 RepID=UPI0013F2828A|nr:adenylate cyclase type 10-like [Chelonoidis abingdonii]
MAAYVKEALVGNTQDGSLHRGVGDMGTLAGSSHRGKMEESAGTPQWGVGDMGPAGEPSQWGKMGMSSGPFQMVKVMAASDESLQTTGSSRSPPQRGAGDVEGKNWSLQEWREMAVLSRFPLWGEGDRGSYSWFPQGGKMTHESLQRVQEESVARTTQLVEVASVSYGPLQEVGRMGVLKETSQEMGKKEVKGSFPPRQVQVVALLPDLLVYNNHSLLRMLPSMETFNGVLLCVEITGLTALLEKLYTNNDLNCGTEQLTQMLNDYIEGIMEHVLCFGGDILNFTGDALLVLWKVERSQLSDIITLAAKCSLEMQEQFGFSYTEVGLQLQLKIGLSAGHISQLIVGDEIRQHLLVTGQQVDDVRLAQSLAQAREVILSPNCWELCDRDVLETKMLKGQKAMKLRYLKIFHPPDFDEHFVKCIDHLQHYPNDEVLLREAVALASSHELELALRRFVLGNVLKKIDDNQPLAFVSELRLVTVVSVKLQFHESTKATELCKLVQEATVSVSGIMEGWRGKIIQISTFGKGCTFLCAFGLPGDKREEESIHALDSAISISNFCSKNLMKIELVSIGITSGLAFCRVAGMRSRQEYTVTGSKVKMASRMLTLYPGMISCDEETYSKSGFPSCFFKKLPEKETRDAVSSGVTYEYLGRKRNPMFAKSGFTRKKDGNRPLLGREKEIRVFQAALQGFVRHREGHVVMYEGSTGYGKSRLIAEIDYLAREENHRVISLELSKVDIQESFYAIRSLMAIVFGIDACRPYKRQDILQSKLTGLWDETFYCLLNNQFLVKFPMSAEVSHMDNETKQKEEEMLYLRVLRKAAEEATLIFVIDEAQYMDAASWDFLAKLLSNVPVLIVLSLSPFASKELLPCASAQGIMKSPKTTAAVLQELEPSILLEMARQALGVVSIPREMETFLIQRCSGVPLYCEALLMDLHANEILELYRVPEEDKEEDEWDNLSTSAIRSIPYREPLVSSKEDKELYICTARKDVDLDAIPLPARLKEIAVAQLDSLSPSEQMAVKCAAVIGHTFTPELLLYILPEWTNKKMEETLMSLINSHVFECFGKEARATQAVGSCHLHTHLGPLTIQIPGPEETEDVSLQEELGMLQQDQAMRFCTPLLREGAYELWLGDQKKALHLKCATFLEHKAHKCRSCGGGDFISFHRYALDTQMSNVDSLLGPASKTKGTALALSEETRKRLQTSLAQGKLNYFVSSVSDAAKRTDVPLGQELTIESPMASCEDNLQCRAKSAMNKQVLPDDHLRVEQEFLDRVDKMIKYHKSGKEEATNLAPCECGERVESVVSALARHCLMVNDRTRAFYYLLESAAASLYLSNNYMAYLYLKKASGLQELSALAAFPCLKRRKLKISQFEEATFCSLRGEVCFNMGQIALAKKLIKRALCLLHKGFPRTWLGAFFQSLLEESKHSAYHTQQRQAQHTDRKALAVLQQQIHCLSLLWQLYSLDYTTNRKYSRLAALMEINLADASENKMQIISTYMDFSQFSQNMGYKDEWLKYEMMAIQRSSQCNFTFTRERLLMTAQLTQALAYSKLCLGHLTRSIQLGFQAHTMCVYLQKTSLHCLVLSVLFKSAFLKNKYTQCVRVLEWLWELATQEESVIVLACFYSACLDLLLCDAGFDYRPIEECLQFINQYEASCILKSQSNILLSLYSSLAIWFGRLQHWDLFEDNFTKAQWLVSRTNASLFGTHGFFRFLECQGLLLRRVMEDAPEKVQETRSSTLGYFEEFLSRCSTSPVYHTRVYSLKASVNLLEDEDKSQVPLSKSLKLSATSHNRLEETSLSVSPDSVQNKNQGSGRVEELKDSKDQDEEGTREYMTSVTSRLKSEPRLEELTFVHLQLGQAPASPHTLPTGEPMEYISTAPRTLPSMSRKPQGDGDKV